MVDIPIFFVRFPDGPQEYYQGHPCVSGRFSTNAENFEGENHDVLLAVDTGADHMAIDHDFALSLGMSPAGFITANSEENVPYFQGAIRIDGYEKIIPASLVSRPLKKSGLPFQLVLGRIDLNRFDMVYRPSGGGSFLRTLDLQQGSVEAS